MDDNLGKALKAILANLCVEYASKGEATLTDWLPQIEQAFRDAGWIEPQQTERELVDYCEMCCGGEFEAPKCPKQYMDFDNCIAQNKRVAQAQLTHDKARIQTLEIDYQMLSEEAKGLSDENKELKARMVKLPSEDEFAEMLRLATEKALVKNKLDG